MPPEYICIKCHQNTFALDAYVEYAIIGSDGSSCKDTQKL